MAAITFKFGVQSDVDPIESALGRERPARFAGLGDATELDDAALSKAHADLVNMYYLRQACAEVLAGGVVVPSFVGRNVWLNLQNRDGTSKPLGTQPAWNPPSNPNLARFQLLSWTSKMGTPSFSLPAGASKMGGTCPGATAGQSLVQIGGRKAQQAEVERLTGVPLDIARAICEHCYAEGGQYSTGNVQFAQLMRLAWVEQALVDGTFVQVMSWAVKNANYYLNGKGTTKTKDLDENGDPIRVPNTPERDGKRYFRIHDSGDFFSLNYMAAWKAVADDNPDVMFWAPSRVWAVPGFRTALDQINPSRPDNNFVVRPSSYSLNQPAPAARLLGDGWAAGSTVYAQGQKPDLRARREGPPYQWDCQAYQTNNDKVTCRDAHAPGDSLTGSAKGCRACWKHGAQDERGHRGGLVVNYTFH